MFVEVLGARRGDGALGSSVPGDVLPLFGRAAGCELSSRKDAVSFSEPACWVSLRRSRSFPRSLPRSAQERSLLS